MTTQNPSAGIGSWPDGRTWSIGSAGEVLLEALGGDIHDKRSSLELAKELASHYQMVSASRESYKALALHLFGLLRDIEALDPNDDKMSKVEFRGTVRELARRRSQCVSAETPCNWEHETRAVLVRALHLDPDDERSNVALAADLAAKYQEASEVMRREKAREFERQWQQYAHSEDS